MRKVVYIIICLFLLVGCSTRKSQKEQVADVSLKEQLKDEKIELVHEDTVIAEIPSTEVVEPKLSVEKVSAISNKQINITYKGKDRNRIVKATDIFKDISRFESRAGFFASTRDECLSPQVRLECNPEIPVAPGEEHWLLDTSLDVYWPCSHSRAIPSFPSQLEWKNGLPWANTRGILNSPS